MVQDNQELYRKKAEKLRLLEEKLKQQQGLPHRHALKRYKWQKAYEDNKFNPKRLICAANQIGKSTIQICDRIEIAVSPDLWPELWPAQFKVNPSTRPYSWYLYPNQDTVMTEFREKWEPYYLPKGEYKDHPVFGWKEHINNKVLKYIEFNSGYKIYFKTYNQNVMDLQSGTVFAIDCDEELPEKLLPELQARLFATDGYFSIAFTATLGQEFWYKAIERVGERDEIWPDAFKVQVSMFDCIEYADGTSTPWTLERIRRVEANCKSQAERNRRIRGRFVKDEGLKYPTFTRELNYRPYPTANGKSYKGAPKGWSIYSATDIGSGGENNHPAAYSFLALSQCLSKIRWFRGRRLDGIETTAGDIYKFYKRDRAKLECDVQTYDWASKEFGLIVERAGESFDKANKDDDFGTMAVNLALKTGMFKIYYDPDDPECESAKLAREFESLSLNTNKRNAKDDFVDTVKYAIASMPIDWDLVLNGGKIEKKDEPKPGSPERERPNDYNRYDKDQQDSLQDEINEWAELFDSQ